MIIFDGEVGRGVTRCANSLPAPLGDLNDDLVGSTGKFEPFIRETQPDQFMSFH
jgi:hypothetical protein